MPLDLHRSDLNSLEAILFNCRTVVKSSTDSKGNRMVEVQASSEDVDGEGDIIRQKALLNSADTFLKSGHIDIDHLSEIGDRLGIADPTSYIIGRPTDVKDIGSKCTSVIWQVFKAKDGEFDPKKNRYDSFWQSLQTNPPVKWASSIYGYPQDDGVEDCREKTCASGATRFIVNKMDFRSLAMTRNPVNDSITGFAKIVSSKAFVREFMKGGNFGEALARSYPTAAGAVVASDVAQEYVPPMATPWNMDELVGQYHNHIKACAHTGGMNSVEGFKDHFKQCCKSGEQAADILSHALMHHIHLARKRGE